MTHTLWLLIAIAAPVATGLLTLFLPRPAIAPRVLLALLGPASATAIVAWVVSQQAPAEAVPTDLVPWVPSLHLNFTFMLDGLGAFFALLVGGIGCMIVLYARGYFGPSPDDLYRFYPTLGFFCTAMLGLVMSDHTLTTLLFWEMTSISSFLLIGWDRYDKEAVRLAMQAFFTTGLGGLGLLGGILLLGFTIDHWTWSETIRHFQYHPEDLTDPAVLGAFFLMMSGAMTKSAQFPFHYWLPGAMAAPTPVSAYLHSATMVKAGVYLTGRLFPALGSVVNPETGVAEADFFWWPLLIIPIGAVTMTAGALIAINQHDLKKIFAYTTVSQLGLLMTMYGLGGLDYTAHGHTVANLDLDITQIANHAFYKAPLFIIAGALGHVLSRNITQLHGAFYKRPAMCVVLLMAGFALAGLPGSISFQAKELFLYAIVHSYQTIGSFWLLLMGMAIVTAACNVAIFVRLTTTVLGLPGSMGAQAEAEQSAASGHAHHDPHDDHAEDDDHAHGHHDDPHDPPGSLWGALIWLPGLIIVLPQFIGGFAPSLWVSVFGPLEANANYFLGPHTGKDFGYDKLPSVLYAFTHPATALFCSLIAIASGVAIGFSRMFRGEFKDPANGIYPAMYSAAVDGGRQAFGLVQTGNLRHYLVFVIGGLTLAFFAAAFFDPAMVGPLRDAAAKAGEYWPGVALAVFICGMAIAMPLTGQRLVRVLLLGATGMGVVSLYLVYQAPDLALTQLMVEIISVLLFVLVLRLLPRRETGKKSPGVGWRLGLGVAAGLAFGWMTIVTAMHEPTHLFHNGWRLGEFFTQYTYDGQALTDGRGGGGDNIVNVILVDFRGFDTFGEIIVLALAALGVFSLIRYRRARNV